MYKQKYISSNFIPNHNSLTAVVFRYVLLFSRNTLGLTPVSFLKTRLKYEILLKPQSFAISSILREGSLLSISQARVIRRELMCETGVVPTNLLNTLQ